jgi:flagellar biosynthesis/type III secretory pathway M-ring protein FliF/YscJ
VKGCAVFPNDDALFVGPYSDVVPPELPTAGQATSTSQVTGIASRYGKEIGVGSLAAISLFMVSMMVRKGGTSVVEAAEPASDVEPEMLDSGDGIIGNATEGSASLDGMELDEETVKAQQMLSQVQQMVQANPDGAANLVKRWLNR